MQLAIKIYLLLIYPRLPSTLYKLMVSSRISQNVNVLNKAARFPPPQVILEICLQGSGISVHGPSLSHSTRGIALSWVWSSGASIAEICAAADWASPFTFARFYNLDVPALQTWVLSA